VSLDVLDDLFRSCHNAHNQIAMPANELGRGINNEISTQEDGLLQGRRGEGVIDDQQGSGVEP
jgi:hypothetical protein